MEDSIVSILAYKKVPCKGFFFEKEVFFMSCRMYEVRPEKLKCLCYICAVRGGWPDCDLSKDEDLVKRAYRLLQM